MKNVNKWLKYEQKNNFTVHFTNRRERVYFFSDEGQRAEQKLENTFSPPAAWHPCSTLTIAYRKKSVLEYTRIHVRKFIRSWSAGTCSRKTGRAFRKPWGARHLDCLLGDWNDRSLIRPDITDGPGLEAGQARPKTRPVRKQFDHLGRRSFVS